MDELGLSDKELALLGLVAEEAAHAYRVEAKIRERSMDVWADIALSSVYRVLQGLDRRGLIDSRLEDAGQGPPRKVYAITEAGRVALRSSLAQRLNRFEKMCRDPFFLNLANVLHLGQDEVLEALGARLATVEELLRMHEDQARDHLERVEVLVGQREGDEQRILFSQRAARLIIGLLFDRTRRQLEAERDAVRAAMEMVGAAGVDEVFAYWHGLAERGELGHRQSGAASAAEVER